MKKALFIFSLLSAAVPFHIESCPSCLGRIEQESPPFFTDEFDKQTTQNVDHLYQKLLAQQKQETENSSDREAS